jgi:serine/threonine protein kinase
MTATDREPARPASFLDEEAHLRAFERQQQRRREAGALTRVPAAADPFILEPGARVAEHYEVGPIIGAGRLGIVYKARHVELGQLVALKVIRPDVARDPIAWRRFSKDARALAALHNEHVVRVHDAGTLDSGLRYLVMELLRGCTLRALLESPVPQQQAVDMVIQVCSALADAHRANIIHRDLKPENIFIARYRAAQPTVKLLDFGMALFLEDAGQSTVTLRSKTMPDYLSPEQLGDARSVDARSDLWSVGMLLYELCAGRTPFVGLNTLQTCLQIAGGTVPRIETTGADVAPELAAIIHRCLEVERSRRPQSADELSLALEPLSSRHAVARREAEFPDGREAEPPDGREAEPSDSREAEPSDSREAEPPDRREAEPPDGREAEPPDRREVEVIG